MKEDIHCSCKNPGSPLDATCELVSCAHGSAPSRTDDTFHDDDTHISFAEPFCPNTRRSIVRILRAEGWIVNDGGTMVAIRGPRYSTRAESRWYAAQGWDLISMTPYPEAALARELDIAYTCVALVTDHDVIGDTPWPVNQSIVEEGLEANTLRLRKALLEAVAAVAAGR
ncbi:phosphorylase family protein [Rhodococcoides kyotonense]|uniref:5'-methylthioadenosine phosphorylase n=1 Tax=Rhodococcoides kyotonense TaxID=398843 RepID=A0A239N928_9NOCA|nr:5'-methylthioadenosine phosphorylase [Rhodococcus kyotonensis]